MKTLSKFQFNLIQSPTGQIYYTQDNLTLRILPIHDFYFILCALLVYLFYYGYEKFNEISSGDAFSSDRIMGDILDVISFSLALLAIGYSTKIILKYRALVLDDSTSPNGFIHQKDFDFLANMKKFGREGTKVRSTSSNLILDLIYTCIDTKHLPQNVTKSLKIECIEKLDNYSNEYYLFYSYFTIFSIICLTRLFKYSIIHRPLEIIVKSIRTILINLIEFSMFFLLIFFGFVLFGISVFGPTMQEYQTFNRACLTLVGIIFGELKYEKYYEYSSLIGTCYFCAYVIVIYIVMFNILSAVITESYASVKNYLNSDSQKLHIRHGSAFIQRNFNILIHYNFIKDKYEYEMKAILEGRIMQYDCNIISRF